MLDALGTLAPERAAAWLNRHERDARDLWPEREISARVGGIIRSGLARSVTDVRVLADLASRYVDLLDADTVAKLLMALRSRREDGVGEILLADALRRAPSHPGLLRLSAESVIERGDDAAAHELLTRLALADTSQANVNQVWRKRSRLTPSGRPEVRVALMSSFTIDPLAHYLDVECRLLGLEPRIHITPFNSWAQEMLEVDSALYGFGPEVAFLSASIDDLIPELVGAPAADRLAELGEAAVDRVLSAARAFAETSPGALIVHGFHSAYPDPQGVVGGSGMSGRSAWLGQLNARLSEELHDLPRTYLLDMNDLLLRRPDGLLDNPKMRHMAGLRICGPVLHHVAHAYACYIAAHRGLTRKCVVIDLDNTIWGGIVGEDGPHGIKLGETAPGSEYREFQRYLLSLTERGFLLAVNSKNNPDDALEVIRSHDAMVLREEGFAAMRINWRPKPENMSSIAEELNIGVDSLVFVDDNPHERELMRSALPEVLTVELPEDPSLYRWALEMLPELHKLVVTDEDRGRAVQYVAKRQREQARSSTPSLDDYLHSLDIVVTIAEADESTLARVHQLFQRTNQFNLTTRRYQEGELADFSRDPGQRLYTLRAADRFGDHGLVATALVRAAPEEWTVDSFLMSCRVIGLGVETALLSSICADARAAEASGIIGEYIETAKNRPASDFYSSHGFSLLDEEDGVARWRRSLADPGPACPAWIRTERAR